METHGGGPARDMSRLESTRVDEVVERPGISSAVRNGEYRFVNLIIYLGEWVGKVEQIYFGIIFSFIVEVHFIKLRKVSNVSRMNPQLVLSLVLTQLNLFDQHFNFQDSPTSDRQ